MNYCLGRKLASFAFTAASGSRKPIMGAFLFSIHKKSTVSLDLACEKIRELARQEIVL